MYDLSRPSVTKNIKHFVTMCLVYIRMLVDVVFSVIYIFIGYIYLFILVTPVFYTFAMCYFCNVICSWKTLELTYLNWHLVGYL